MWAGGFIDVERSETARWATVPFVLLGPAGGGVGGGLKVTTLVLLLVGGVRLLRGRAVDRSVGVAIVWAIGFATLAAVAALALRLAWPQAAADVVAITSAAAVANVAIGSPTAAGTRRLGAGVDDARRPRRADGGALVGRDAAGGAGGGRMMPRL